MNTTSLRVKLLVCSHLDRCDHSASVQNDFDPRRVNLGTNLTRHISNCCWEAGECLVRKRTALPTEDCSAREGCERTRDLQRKCEFEELVLCPHVVGRAEQELEWRCSSLVKENLMPSDIQVFTYARLIIRRILISALTISFSACASHQDAVHDSTETRATAADCAAERGPLDIAFRQCVPIRSIKPRSRAALQLTPTSNHVARIESHAIIDDSLKGQTKLMTDMIALLRSRGYHCDAISSARPFTTSNGFRLTCDHARFRYEIEADEGSWDIRAK